MSKRRVLTLAAWIAFVGLSAAHARADLLGLTQRNPDIWILEVQAEYNSAMDTLSMSGLPCLFVASDNVEHLIEAETHSFLTATKDYSGNWTGTLSIMGVIEGLGAETPLLTGTLAQLGFAPDYKLMEFLFDVTGGSLKNIMGNRVGITASFSEMGRADVFAVPAPAGAALVLIGVASIGAIRRFLGRGPIVPK